MPKKNNSHSSTLTYQKVWNLSLYLPIVLKLFGSEKNKILSWIGMYYN